MRALVLTGPAQLEMVEVDPPNATDLGADQAIIETLAGGVCGSDLSLFLGAALPDVNFSDEIRFGKWRLGFPMHEVVGTVIASNSSLQVGERVVGWAHRNSGLAERVVVDAPSVFPIDNQADPIRQVAIQPFACILHALNRVGEIQGKRAAVLGLGPIGLSFTEILHAFGAAHVTGVDRYDRIGDNYEFGIDEKVVSSTDRWAHSISTSDRYDLVIEAIGHHPAPLNHAIEVAAPEGCVFAFGGIDDPTYSIEVRAADRKNLTLITGFTPMKYRQKALSQAVEYLGDDSNALRAYVTNVFPADRAQEAYELACHPGDGQIKTVISWL